MAFGNYALIIPIRKVELSGEVRFIVAHCVL